jgi:hypothetical protein
MVVTYVRAGLANIIEEFSMYNEQARELSCNRGRRYPKSAKDAGLSWKL